MLQMGYRPSEGLGRDHQGRLHPIEDRDSFFREGLRYLPEEDQDYGNPQPLTWSLYDHFVQGPTEGGTKNTRFRWPIPKSVGTGGARMVYVS